jgi:hypothetical protein
MLDTLPARPGIGERVALGRAHGAPIQADGGSESSFGRPVSDNAVFIH